MLRRVFCLAALLCTTTLRGAEAPTAVATNGERVFICGHSFHIFTSRYLGPIAKAAELADHETVGAQMIGGSSVTQHWELDDEKNKVKQALKAGTVDVLTLSPNWILPDPAIEKFVDLGLEHNPKMRFVVQMSWTAYDGRGRNPKPAQFDRDAATIAELRPPQEMFAKVMETQIKEINAKHDHPVVFISPVGFAVLTLREKVIQGEAPGIKKQSDLYNDPLGHGKPPILALCSYVNFATIYGKSPVGLKPFDSFDGNVSPELHKLLQQIAWDTVTSYGPSGVKK